MFQNAGSMMLRGIGPSPIEMRLDRLECELYSLSNLGTPRTPRMGATASGGFRASEMEMPHKDMLYLSNVGSQRPPMLGSTAPTGRAFDMERKHNDTQCSLSHFGSLRPPMTGATAPGVFEASEIEKKCNEMMVAHQELMASHRNDMVVAHKELMASHRQLLTEFQTLATGAASALSQKTVADSALSQHAGAASALSQQTGAASTLSEKSPLEKMEEKTGGRIGVVRLDGANYSAPVYSKKAVLGDAASSKTWERKKNISTVFYQRPEGYTFTVCKYGLRDQRARVPQFAKEGCIKIKGREGDKNHMFVPNRRGGPNDQPRPRRPSRTEPWIEDGEQIGVMYFYDSETMMINLTRCVQDLAMECKVDCITSACGFMANVQHLVSEVSHVPCLMSSLNLLPIIDLMTSRDSVILVLTANSDSFSDSYRQLINPHWDIPRHRVELVGLQDLEGFGKEVATGTTVDISQAEENIVQLVRWKVDSLKPVKVACILSECTELPGYTNTLRESFAIPVFDAITAANVLLNGMFPREEYSIAATYEDAAF